MTSYENFMTWKKENNVNDITESVLLVYFTDLGKKYSPSSLWSYHSMLKSTLNIYQGINIENYKKLTTFLKTRAKGFLPKKANTFTSVNILEFLTKAWDHIYLATKVNKIRT